MDKFEKWLEEQSYINRGLQVSSSGNIALQYRSYALAYEKALEKYREHKAEEDIDEADN